MRHESCTDRVNIKILSLGVVVHVFNPSFGEVEADGFCEFEARLVYIEDSRTARVT